MSPWQNMIDNDMQRKLTVQKYGDELDPNVPRDQMAMLANQFLDTDQIDPENGLSNDIFQQSHNAWTRLRKRSK